MPLESTTGFVRPGQEGATGSPSALHIEEYTGIVEGTIARKSAIKGFVPVRPVRGTSVLQSYAVGEASLQKVVPGVTPDGTTKKQGKNTLTVDTLVLARDFFPLLETWQSSYDARAAYGEEHGKLIAKFLDQAFMIQAVIAARRTSPKFSGGLDTAGHQGGTQITFAGASDHLDPAKLYAKIAEAFVGMESKDVDPRVDDVVLAMKPAEFYTLQQNEMLVDSTWKSADGNDVHGQRLRSYGVPIINTNNLPTSVISGHLLSNVDNGNAYDGDFSKVVALAFSPRALLAGETIPLTNKLWYDDKSLMWTLDDYLSFGVTANRPEFAAVISKP